MGKNKKRGGGYVYSTNPDFEYDDQSEDFEDIPFDEQELLVFHDRKQRKGKVVTIVQGFYGSNESLKELSKELKSKCGVGGSVKDGEIIIQGQFADKVLQLLSAKGAKVKKSGG